MVAGFGNVGEGFRDFLGEGLAGLIVVEEGEDLGEGVFLEQE